jgi:hypothetical protein
MSAGKTEAARGAAEARPSTFLLFDEAEKRSFPPARCTRVSGVTYRARGRRQPPFNGWNRSDLKRTTQMTRREHEELQRRLTRARKLALESGNALSQERAARAIEDLEYQLVAGRLTAQAIEAGY